MPAGRCLLRNALGSATWRRFTTPVISRTHPAPWNSLTAAGSGRSENHLGTRTGLTPFRVKPAALAAAVQVLGWAKQNGFPPADLGFHAGGVWIEWRQRCKDLRVVIHADGIAEYLLHGEADGAVEAACALLRATLGPSSQL